MEQSDAAIQNFKSNCSALETLNTDCLIQIFAHLDIIDVINLVSTCTTLLNFAKADFFPRKAKQITIEESDQTNVFIQAPMINECRSKITVKCVETAFNYLADFVEDLTIYLLYGSESTAPWCSVILLKDYKYLKTLRYRDWSFTTAKACALNKQIERFENLSELDLAECYDITNNWPPSFKCNSNINEMTLHGTNEITTNFVKYFSNLSSLTIDFIYSTCCQIDDVARILNSNGHCLKHLRLERLYHLEGYESMGPVIVNNTPKLESLSIHLELTDDSMSLISLPHLKFVEMFCVSETQNINTFLRTLSYIGIIEELDMTWGDSFVDDPPLIFNNLQCIHWCAAAGESNILKTMTKSHMPAIHTFTVTLLDHKLDNDLLKFIESKKTLRSLHIGNINFDFEFLLQIINILKEPCTPKRPFLMLSIPIIELADEKVN